MRAFFVCFLVIHHHNDVYESNKVLNILNLTYLESIANHYLITSNDWSQVNKTTKFAIKSIENKNDEYYNLLLKQVKFEYSESNNRYSVKKILGLF